MQSKSAITILHAMAGMCGMHKLYVRYWSAGNEIEYVLHNEYYYLLPVRKRRPHDSSFNNY